MQDDYSTRTDPILKCAAVAKKLACPGFAVQNGGECWCDCPSIPLHYNAPFLERERETDRQREKDRERERQSQRQRQRQRETDSFSTFLGVGLRGVRV